MLAAFACGVLDGRMCINERDEAGATVLHYATLDGLREIVQLLLDRGAEINSLDGQFGATPTGWAIEYLLAK
jgi:ankyrin repeat protein